MGKDKVVEPPSETVPPPDRPVPAVTVKEELARAALAIELAGRVTAPDETVNPFEAVNSPAEVMVPVPDVEIFPEVVMASPAVAGESVVPVLLK